MVGGYWADTFPYPGAGDLSKEYEKQTGQSSSQHIADSSTAAAVLLDAITAAGSLNKSKINDAIGKTNKTYVVGPIKFGADHTSTLPMVETQWQDGKTVVVAPKNRANAKVLFPMP
jgi:branched-chain amino acid transport system substrate-binding protein